MATTKKAAAMTPATKSQRPDTKVYNDTPAGKAALERMRKAGITPPPNFFFHAMRNAHGFTKGLGGIVLTGAQFRQAERGRTAGAMTVKVPGSTVTVFVEA